MGFSEDPPFWNNVGKDLVAVRLPNESGARSADGAGGVVFVAGGDPGGEAFRARAG